jgi:hypothetical protein
LAAGDYGYIEQKIEGIGIPAVMLGTASAKPLVLRFDAYCTVPGLYSVVFRNANGTFSYVKGINLTGAWQTFVIPISPMTGGVWPIDTNQGASVCFVFACGSSGIGTDGVWQTPGKLGVPGMANVASVAGQYFLAKNVGLYLDPNNTGLAPPFQVPDEVRELRTCQRYYQSITGNVTSMWGAITSGQTYAGQVKLTVPMRVNSSVSGANSGVTSGFPAAVGTLTVIDVQTVRESRVANTTGTGGFFSFITANARMP